MIHLKTTTSLMLVGIMMASLSCKKSKPKKEEINPPPKDDTTEQIFIPIKFQSDKLAINLKYTDNTASLTEIANTDGYTTTITYQQLLPKQIKRFRNSNAYSFTDFETTNGNIAKIKSFNEDGRLNTPTGHYLLNYDAKKISTINYYNASNILIQQKKINYNSSGTITDFILNDLSETGNSFTYTYDLKNGIFKHVKQTQLLLPELSYSFFNYSESNVISCTSLKTPQENILYTYEYNSDGYPSKIKFTENGKQNTYVITYKKLQQ